MIESSSSKRKSKSFGPISEKESLLQRKIPSYLAKSLELVMEGSIENRDFQGKQSIIDPSFMLSRIRKDALAEDKIINLSNLLAKITPPHHHLHVSREISQSQRYGELMTSRYFRTIKGSTKEKRVSHPIFHLKLLSSYQQIPAKMSRNFERAAPKRNSALNLEPIVIDPFDNSDLLAAYDLTLVGRVLNTDLQAHRVKALLALMPQAWNLEGRVQGNEVGRGKFHFRFNTEEDLHAVLEKRPYFFDQWMFPLEHLVPSVRTDFPSTMIFTVFIEGIPDHYLKE